MGLLNILSNNAKKSAEADKKLATILGDDIKRNELLKMVSYNKTVHDDLLKLIEITGSPFDAKAIEDMAKKYFGDDLSKMDPTKIAANAELALNGEFDREVLQRELDVKIMNLEKKEALAKSELQKNGVKTMKIAYSDEQKMLDRQNELAGAAAFYALLYGTLRGHGGVWSKEETELFEWTDKEFNPKSKQAREQIKNLFGENAKDFVKRQAIQKKSNQGK